MSGLRRLLQDLRMARVLLCARRVVSLAGLPPTLSLGFDDFPASAARLGARVLEEHGCRGSFYLCAGRLGGDSPSGPIATAEDVLRLAAAGHDIGCHTFSHLRAAATSPQHFARDLDRNIAALTDLLGAAPRSFAYPYGSVTPEAKRAAGARHLCCRSTLPRLNRGRADLNLLYAAPLYARQGFAEQALGLLSDCAAGGGWLVLYGHDVSERPSPHGCTPGQLEALLREAARLGVQVAPAGQVAQRLTAGGNAP